MKPQMSDQKISFTPGARIDDQELLFLAAKAEGRCTDGVLYDELFGLAVLDNSHDKLWWNPLNDDKAAFRLMVRLMIDLIVGRAMVRAEYVDVETNETLGFTVNYTGIAYRAAAVRRAITIVAALMGKRML